MVISYRNGEYDLEFYPIRKLSSQNGMKPRQSNNYRPSNDYKGTATHKYVLTLYEQVKHNVVSMRFIFAFCSLRSPSLLPTHVNPTSLWSILIAGWKVSIYKMRMSSSSQPFYWLNSFWSRVLSWKESILLVFGFLFDTSRAERASHLDIGIC